MASILEDRRKKKEEASTTTGGGGISSIGGGGQPQSQPQGSGRFVNLSKYLGANVGAGERVSKRIGREGTQAAGRIGQGIMGRAGDVGLEKSGGSYKASDEGKMGKIRAGIEAAQGSGKDAFDLAGKPVDTGVGSDNMVAKVVQHPKPRDEYLPADGYRPMPQPMPILNDPGATLGVNRPATGGITDEMKQQIQGLIGGGLGSQIKGISTDISGLTGQVSDLQGMASDVGTQAGRFGLLSKSFGGPRKQYTSGQQSLDELFLQATPEAAGLQKQFQEQAQASAKDVYGLGQALGSEKGNLLREAGAGTDFLKDLFLRGQWQGEDVEGLAGGVEDIESYLDERKGAVEGETEKLREDVMESVGTEDFWENYADMYGLSKDDILFDQDLKKYAESAGATGATAAGLVSEQDAERYNILSELAGLTPELFADAESYGDYNPLDIDKSALETEIGVREKEFATDFNPLAKKVTGLTKAGQNISTGSFSEGDLVSGKADQAIAGMLKMQGLDDGDVNTIISRVRARFNDINQIAPYAGQDLGIAYKDFIQQEAAKLSDTYRNQAMDIAGGYGATQTAGGTSLSLEDLLNRYGGQ